MPVRGKKRRLNAAAKKGQQKRGKQIRYEKKRKEPQEKLERIFLRKAIGEEAQSRPEKREDSSSKGGKKRKRKLYLRSSKERRIGERERRGF